MIYKVKPLQNTWDVAKLFAPQMPEQEVESFSRFLVERIRELFSEEIKKIELRNNSMNQITRLIIKEKMYRLIDALAFIRDSLIIEGSDTITLSGSLFQDTGVSADQLFRVIEYGNPENSNAHYLSNIFRKVNQNLNAYWMAYFSRR